MKVSTHRLLEEHNLIEVLSNIFIATLLMGMMLAAMLLAVVGIVRF